MEAVFRMYASVARMVLRATWGLSRALTKSASGAMLSRQAARNLRPGAADYRGMLADSRTPKVLNGEFPIGRFLTTVGRTSSPAGISEFAVRHNTCVVGPPGAGKTRYVIVPWIIAAIRAGYSVVCIDVKGDMLDLIRDQVRRDGVKLGVRARSLDYTRPSTSLRWSWLADLDSDRAIDSAVMSIVGKQPPPNTDPFFFHMDSQILRGLLELIGESPNRSTMTTSTLLRTLKNQDALERTLQRYPHNPGVTRLADLINLAADDYSKRVSGVAVRLDALARPTVEKVTSDSDFAMGDVLDRQGLVSIVAPMQDGQLAQTLSGLFINDLLFRAYNRFASPNSQRVLLVLDEAAQLADRVDYKNVLSVARSANVAVMIAVQDVAQFPDVNERSAVFGNCGSWISFAGVSPESAKLLSDRLGTHSVLSTTVSRAPGSFGHQTSTSNTTTQAPVLGTREIMTIPFGHRPAVVHARDVLDSPFLVDFG